MRGMVWAIQNHCISEFTSVETGSGGSDSVFDSKEPSPLVFKITQYYSKGTVVNIWILSYALLFFT
jgi:hypothetical protein